MIEFSSRAFVFCSVLKAGSFWRGMANTYLDRRVWVDCDKLVMMMVIVDQVIAIKNMRY
jgi:hypothetical protein